MAYSITSGNGAGYFTINSSTGEITLHASGVGNLSGSYVLTRHDDVANTNQQITVNIKPNAITVDAAHPLTDTVGTDSYSWTLPKPTTCFQFADGTWAAVPPAAGQSITAFSPAPISRTVTDYDGSSGSKAVDGAQVMGSWAFSAVDQGIDQRQPHFVTGLRPTAPVSLAAGYKLLTMKSLDTPPTTGGDVAQAMRKSCLSSAHVVTALNAVPVDMTKKYYRPGLFHDTSQVSTATLIPQFDVTTSWPTLASPTAVDMSGNAVTLDFSELEAELVYYDPAGALGLFRNYQVPGDAIYEAWGTRHQAWKTHGAAASAYNFDRFLLWRFIRQRVNKTSDAAAQAIIDEIIQYTLDWDSLIEKAKAASLTSLNVGWPHGGHVNCVAHVLVIGAWALMTIGGATATTIATRVYNRLIQDSPDFMPVTQRQWWVNSKEVNASNRATCNFYDRTGTLATATAPVTTVNFGAIDWKAAGLTEQTSNDRIPQGMLGLQFQITSGSAQGFYMVVGWTFDENSWNGIGGDGWVVSPNWTNRTPPSPGDTFKFLVATTEALDWCADAFGGPLVGHNTDAYLSNAYIGNTFHGTFFPRLAGSYSPQNMPQQRSAYIAMYGLTCALWANGAETLTPNARTKWFWERARSIGHTAYSWNCNSTYDIWNPSIEALHRHYLHGGNGHRDWDLYPAVKDTTVPTLSSLSGDASTFNFTTNYPFHRAYWVVTTSATQPTAAQIRAGQDHTGAAASLSGSVSINTAGTKTIGHSLTPGTYYLHVVQDTPSGYSSAVTSSSAVVVAAYSPSFITFDGGDYATKNGLAIVGGDYGMLRFAFRAPNTAGPILSMGPDGWSDRIRISWNANGMVGVRVRTDGGGYVFEDQIFSGLTPNTIYDCVVAWDSVADVARWLLNGSTTSTFYHWGGTLLGSTNTVGRIGANRDGGIFVGDLSIVQVWMNLPSMPDLTNATLQALFYSGGASKDPAALESVVGASDISFWGNAANFNAGHINPFSDPSSLWSVTGAVVDA